MCGNRESKELPVYRIDEPRLLGRIPKDHSSISATANRHSIFLFDYKTFRITRYPLNTLKADKSYQVVTDNRSGFFVDTGANGMRSPIFITDQYNVEFIDPFTMRKMRVGVRNHNAATGRRTIVRLSNAVYSPNGDVVSANGQLCWLQNGTFHAFANRINTGRCYPRLTYNGGNLCHSGQTSPIAPMGPSRNRTPSPQGTLILH